MGMTDVACFTAGAEVSLVTMILTLNRVNSAATSAMRSERPSDQRYSIAMLRPSIQPSSRSRAVKGATHGDQADASPPKRPTVGSLPACCARAASGHAAAVPPSIDMNSRRFIASSQGQRSLIKYSRSWSGFRTDHHNSKSGPLKTAASFCPVVADTYAVVGPGIFLPDHPPCDERPDCLLRNGAGQFAANRREDGSTMLRGLIAFCLLRRALVLIAFAAFLGLGLVAFTALNIEAYPDPAPPIVEIIAQRPGQSPEEMERYVTIPIEIAIASTPGLRYIRSNTVYALSFIRLQFEYGRDYHFVRQQTINRLREADLPQGVQPVISPAGTISEIFRYELKGPPEMDVMQLKTLQDWVVERRLRMVPGVSDVLVLGGKTREFQAEIDLTRMRAFGVSIPQIINAISTNNANVGGRTIAMGEQAVNVRGFGLVRSLEDIGNVVLTQQSGVPVLVSDVAKIQIGFTPRLGIAGRDDTTDIVTGIVLMQKFERTMD